MRTMLTMCLGLAILSLISCPLACAEDSEASLRVTASRLNVREGPGPDNPVVASVARGEILVRLDEQSGWVKVRTSDGTVGWVSASYVEPVAPAESGEREQAQPSRETVPQIKPARSSASGNGGSLAGKLLKWGSLAGAGVFGYLAYDEHSAGNDSYDEYKTLARGGDADAAEEKYSRTEDHDSKSQTFQIVAGALAATFVLQEFVLGGGSEDQAALDRVKPLRLAWDPARREVRAGLDLTGLLTSE
jgi:uncharacterized protein YraI